LYRKIIHKFQKIPGFDFTINPLNFSKIIF
jgi:hypothetical protein